MCVWIVMLKGKLNKNETRNKKMCEFIKLAK